jgi:hypothetical protein
MGILPTYRSRRRIDCQRIAVAVQGDEQCVRRADQIIKADAASKCVGIDRTRPQQAVGGWSRRRRMRFGSCRRHFRLLRKRFDLLRGAGRTVWEKREQKKGQNQPL